MLCAVLVASVSFGTIAPGSHPSTRLLADADVPVLRESRSTTLVELEKQLDVEMHRTSLFVAPGILFGATALHAVVGVVFVVLLPKLLWTGLVLMIGFFSVATVLLITAIATSIAAAVRQGTRTRHIQELREEIARLKAQERMPAMPPPSVQNIPVVMPQFVLAHF